MKYKAIKNSILRTIAKGMTLVLLTGTILNHNPRGILRENVSYNENSAKAYSEKEYAATGYDPEEYDIISVYAADGLSDGRETVSTAASKKTSALVIAQQKAEKKLLDAYDVLTEQYPYSQTNFEKLTSIKDEGVQKIYAVKEKTNAGKTAKKYIKSLKKVKNLLDETGKEICIGYQGTVAWKAVKGAKKYKVCFTILREDIVIGDHWEEMTKTYAKLTPGFGVEVHAIDSDGDEISNILSGTYARDEFYLCNGYLQAWPVVDKTKLQTWDAFEKVYPKSLKKNSDGSVSFEVEGPNGERVRFWGEDVDVKSDCIILHRNGRVMMTDGIGRIYSIKIVVSDPGSDSNWINMYGGYNIDYDMHPGTIDKMVYTAGMGRYTCDFKEEDVKESMALLEPNFAGVGVLPPSYNIEKERFGHNADDTVVSKFILEYIPSKKATRFKNLILDANVYGAYLTGDKYDKSKEIYSPYTGEYYMTLYAAPDLDNDTNEIPVEVLKTADMHALCVNASDGNFFKVGDLKDPDGKKIDKDKASVERGTTLNIRLGKESFDVGLEVVDTYEGAQTFHDLLPYAFPAGTGKRNILVVPIVWQDEPDRASEQILNEIRSKLGRAASLDGKIKDYSDGIDGNQFSLSEYFDLASYGKITVNSYITDWYIAPCDFSEWKYHALNWDFICEVIDWVYKKYPDTDFTKFDLDSNGYFDQVFFINSGDMSKDLGFSPSCFNGASQYRNTYGNEYAGTNKKPTVNNVVNMNTWHLRDNTLIHEFSHGFGLIDYYDVTYSGINAVGGYDMQSDSVGDWNAYSKYAAGWIEPKIISGLKPGESVEVKIGALCERGDAIVIPAATETLAPPFSEYMLVDLYTSSGVNQYDSQMYGINDFTGVRIYHVDARMEKRDFVNNLFPDMEPCTIGTIHIANEFKKSRMFNIELIQAGAKNTFTAGNWARMRIEKGDFFQTGDVFTMDKYSEFFNDGLMDTGAEFGYKIEIVSVSGTGADAQAVIRITKE